jgi:lysophospholipase L1-like esterase
MRYLSLGDSISIDDYTGVAGGGAASQFARALGASEFWALARDGYTTHQVLETLRRFTGRPDVVTLTVSGNDFLMGEPAAAILARVAEIVVDLGRL